MLRREVEELSDECCSKMSLFYAEATPMLKLISRYATQCHMVVSLPSAGEVYFSREINLVVVVVVCVCPQLGFSNGSNLVE